MSKLTRDPNRSLGNAVTEHESLWQGPIPPTGGRLDREGFQVLVLAAREFQPRAERFPGVKVMHAPLNDARPTLPEVGIAMSAAKTVAAHLRRGDRVLVTCAAGLNRSGWIVAEALIQLGHRSDAAVKAVRRARGPKALSNPFFVALLTGGKTA